MKDYTGKEAVERLPNNLLNNVEIKTAIAQLHLAEQTSTAGDIVTYEKSMKNLPMTLQ